MAIEPGERNSSLIFIGLLWSVYEHARVNGFTHMYISGVEERVALYERIGFEPLGPAVPAGRARFVPMVLKVGENVDNTHDLHVRTFSHGGHVHIGMHILCPNTSLK